MKDYLWQMLSATQYLHAQHILHLDLRSENMMVTEYNLLKVVDLGNAQILSREKVPPPENFKDYLETMGAYVTPHLPAPWTPTSLSPQPHTCAQPPVSTCASLQLRNSWKAKGLFHRQTSGLLV